MFRNPTTYYLIKGILLAENDSKQRLGQRFADCLRLKPGPEGPDDGIDGSTDFNGKKIHFQCKLSRKPLDKDEARKYYSDVKYHRADVSIMLSGVGYKETFIERLYGHPDIESVVIHLLTLQDVFEKTEAFQNALKDMPPLEKLEIVAKTEIGDSE
ncbi:MAG: restriction endonuclease [Desertifilum sp.]|nr:restriction endonuclease [Desertifilum sp.]